MRPSTKFLLCSASALTLFGVDVGRANACGPPSCDPVVVAPANGSTVPASLPGFPVLDERDNVSLPADAGVPATPIELVNAKGESIALERRELPNVALMVPKVPLVPGPYELRFKATCDLASIGPKRPPNVVHKIAIGPALPLPTSTGSVTTTTARVSNYTVPSGGGSCSVQEDVVMTRVAFQPSAELVPFLPLVRTTVKVDGHEWGHFTWGGGHRHPGNGYIMPPREPFEIVIGCKDGRQTFGIAEGDHKGELIIDLAGAPALPPVPFSFRLDCKASAAAPPGTGGGAGTSPPPGTGGGAGTSPPPGTGGGTGTTAIPPAVEPSPDAPVATDGAGTDGQKAAGNQQSSGCSLGGRPGGRPFLVGLSLGALWFARRRRR